MVRTWHGIRHSLSYFPTLLPCSTREDYAEFQLGSIICQVAALVLDTCSHKDISSTSRVLGCLIANDGASFLKGNTNLQPWLSFSSCIFDDSCHLVPLFNLLIFGKTVSLSQPRWMSKCTKQQHLRNLKTFLRLWIFISKINYSCHIFLNVPRTKKMNSFLMLRMWKFHLNLFILELFL